MKSAALKDDVFLRDVEHAREDTDSLHIWWMGQSGFLVQWKGRHLLFDPYLSDSLTHKYAHTEKPHVRMTERVIDPAELNFIDVVTSTHNHTDHLDAETLVPLLFVNRKMELVIPEANRNFVVERLKCPETYPTGTDAGETKSAGDFEFTAVPAAHEEIEKDDQGRHTHLGYVVKFDGWTVYHSGDTVHFEGMENLLRPHDIDVAFLPINGRRPTVAGNLNGREAAQLAHDIGAGLVVPCHFDMFEFNTEPPDEFIAACEELGQTYRVLRNGERTDISLAEKKSGALRSEKA